MGDKVTGPELDAILLQPNAAHVLMCLGRDGRINPETAAESLQRLEDSRRGRVYRFLNKPLVDIWPWRKK